MYFGCSQFFLSLNQKQQQFEVNLLMVHNNQFLNHNYRFYFIKSFLISNIKNR